MSTTIDSRVVTMKFDNTTFAQKVSTTLDLLARLKNSLNFSSSKKGMDDLSASANKFNLGNMGTHVEGVSAKFLALSTVAITALSNIVNKAVDAGGRIAKSLTIEPVLEGFREYELKLGSIQTIMAGSGEDLTTVNTYLQQLNEYADRTIYSFANMTQNIGKFTNAGVSLKDSVAAIQGVANVAAISGANSEEASRAMYNFAQALSSGHVKLMDWKSIELANMGTVEFKQQLIDSAVAMGSLTKTSEGYVTEAGNVVSATKGFNESLADQWLTSEVLTGTLGRYSDATTDIGKRATAAAQDVKTFTQMLDTMKESAGSGWAETWEIVFGNFDESKALWTNVNNVLGGMLTSSAEARNHILSDWKKLGGRTVLIEGISDAFDALMSVINIVRGAFRDIFPPATGQLLYDLTVRIADFAESLRIGGDTAIDLSRTFRGVFAIFSIGWSVIKALAGVISGLFENFEGAGGGILDFTGNIGDFLVSIDQAIKKGTGFTKFFDKLEEKLDNIVDFLTNAAGKVGEFFSALGAAGLDKANQRLEPMSGFVEKIGKAWDFAGDAMKKAGEFLQPLIDAITGAMRDFGQNVADAMGTDSFSAVLDIINTGLLAGILLLVQRFFKGGISVDVGGGFLDKIGGTFDQLTDSMAAMQTQIQAKTLMLIAAAIALLTASVVALSLIDSGKLTKALTAMSVGFGQLLAAMFVLIKISGAAGFVKIPAIAGAMILLATAVLILSGAIKNLSTLSWEELAVGMAGIAGALALMVGAVVILSRYSGTLPVAAAAMVGMAIAIRILASSVQIFSTMSWEELGQGLAGVATLLGLVVGAMTLMPPNMALQALALIGVALAIQIIGNAVGKMAGMSWEEIGKGMTVLAGSLAILAGALYLMTGTIAGAASLIVAAAALAIITPVLLAFGDMDWEEIGKAMVALAGSLLILAGGLYLMTGAIVGAAALLVAAAALAVLAPVLETLGNLTWEEIAKGLVALAGAFIVIGVAGLVLTPLLPSLLLLGVAVVLLGAGLALAGVGALAFATAFTLLVAAAGAGVVVITAMFGALIALIPQAMAGLAAGIIAFAGVIATGAPAFTAAFVAVLTSLLDAVIEVTPKIGEALLTLIDTLLKILVRAVPAMVRAGLEILLGILEGIRDNIYMIVTVATSLIVEFLRAIGANAGKVADAGFKMLIDFINGITRAINANAGDLREAGRDLAWAIIDGMTGGLASGLGSVINKAKSIATSALEAAKSAIGVSSPSKEFYKVGMWADEGLANGLDAYSSVVEKSAENVGVSALDTIKNSMKRISEATSSNVDLNPVITPVIDLTQFRKDAGQMGRFLNTSPISASVSYGQASSISAEQQVAAAQSTSGKPDTSSTVIKLEQNNYSPEPLKPIDIYRHTRTQLAQAKRALGVS